MTLAWFLNLFFLVLVTSTSACTVCVKKSNATHYASDTYVGGTCAYGNYGLEMSKGYFATVVPSLYKEAAGCGACYHITCKNTRLCNTIGTNVIVVDKTYYKNRDFVVSRKAFSAMAKYGKGQELLNSEIVEIEYKRVPCDYKNKNLLVLLEEASSNPHYVSIKLLYQGGQTDIVAVEIAQVGSSKWTSLQRNYGVVWHTTNVPRGALKLRLTVISGYRKKFIQPKFVFPANWKGGVIYDSGIQINDVAEEPCMPPSKCYK